MRRYNWEEVRDSGEGKNPLSAITNFLTGNGDAVARENRQVLHLGISSGKEGKEATGLK